MPAQFPVEGDRISRYVARRAWGGRYLDIGGGHPTHNSNTYGLYQAGWCGDIYEPYEEYWRKFVRIRPRDVIYPVACSDSAGWREFWRQGELSTLEDSWVRRSASGYTRSIVRVIDAKTLAGVYDFCSLDVEGHEGRILHSLDFVSLRIGVFLIESIEFGTGKSTYPEWEERLLANGYRFLGQFSFLNRFYVHASYPLSNR